MKKEIIIVLVVLALGVLFYQGRVSNESVPSENLNQEKNVVLGLDEVASFGNISLTGWAVTEDSRCPSDVQCIQAGRVKVALRMFSSSGTSTISEIEPGNQVAFEGVNIKLEEVSPYPVSTRKTADGEYRFHFTLSSIKP